MSTIKGKPSLFSQVEELNLEASFKFSCKCTSCFLLYDSQGKVKSVVFILSYFNLQSILKFAQVICWKSVVFSYEKKEKILIYMNLFCDFFYGCWVDQLYDQQKITQTFYKIFVFLFKYHFLQSHKTLSQFCFSINTFFKLFMWKFVLKHFDA